jgi:hypothetical protein
MFDEVAAGAEMGSAFTIEITEGLWAAPELTTNPSRPVR